MSIISDECQERLREIDRRLQMISSVAARGRPSYHEVRVSVVHLRRMNNSVEDLDEACRDILRGLDPKLANIGFAAASAQSPKVIQQFVEEARSSIPRGGNRGLTLGGV